MGIFIVYLLDDQNVSSQDIVKFIEVVKIAKNNVSLPFIYMYIGVTFQWDKLFLAPGMEVLFVCFLTSKHCMFTYLSLYSHLPIFIPQDW